MKKRSEPLPKASLPDETEMSVQDPVQVEQPTGFVKDYISGIQVRATPEEVEAVQVFARRLVDDFGYPPEHIITRPQYRVRRRPSEQKRSYPVDIAVFSSRQKLDAEMQIVVECKAESSKEGQKQLEI